MPKRNAVSWGRGLAQRAGDGHFWKKVCPEFNFTGIRCIGEKLTLILIMGDVGDDQQLMDSFSFIYIDSRGGLNRTLKHPANRPKASFCSL